MQDWCGLLDTPLSRICLCSRKRILEIISMKQKELFLRWVIQQTNTLWLTNLQFVTKILSVRDEAAVLVSLVEPHAAPHFRGLLVPVHGFPHALVQEDVVAAPVRAQHHALRVRLDWDTQPHVVTTLTHISPISAQPQPLLGSILGH